MFVCLTIADSYCCACRRCVPIFFTIFASSMEDNSQYIVSARKYRPASFSTVVGQESLTHTLRNAISGGRLAHAYLFCGPRGVGKTSSARIFAKTINCLNPTPDGEACGECESCRAIDRGNSFNLIELDAASNNSVDDIRSLNEQVQTPPQLGRYRVFIIDEVHMLSTQAFNAFLKTLEEPPSYVIFILATTEKHKILPTILSRCQIYDFKRITVDDMVAHLQRVAEKEGIQAEASALSVIARKADGAMRDALSIFDQVAASSQGNITYASTIENLNVLDYDYYFRLVDAFRDGDVQSSLLIYNEIRTKGFDSLFFINGLASHVRDLMVAADARTAGLMEVSRDVASRYVEQAATMPLPWYYKALAILNEADLNYRTASSKQLTVELALIRLASLLDRLRAPHEPTPQPATPQTPAQQPQAQRQQPQQPQPRQPVQAPQRPPVMAPRRPAREGSAQGQRAATIRINNTDKKEEPDAGSGHAAAASQHDSPAPAREAGAGNVSDSLLLQAWQDFIAANPEMRLVTAAMRVAVPRLVGDSAYEFDVDNLGLESQIEKAMPQLLGFLRERTGNPALTLRTKLVEAPEGKRALTPVEFLNKMVQENEVIKDILKQIDAELT